MKTDEPNSNKDLQKGIGLESNGKGIAHKHKYNRPVICIKNNLRVELIKFLIGQPTVDSLSPTPEQRENLEGQVDPNQAEVAESEQQP